MKNTILLISLISLVTSCSFFSKEKQAIETCQNSKVLMKGSNLFESFALNLYGLNSEATWLDFANRIAQKSPNKKHNWSATKTKVKDIYLVAFTDEMNWGHRWEVDIDQKIVKNVNSNEYLTRKHGLSRMSNSTDFEITKITRDTMKVIKRYKNSKPEIIYEYRGLIKNNTDKSIVSASLKGALKLIFEEKTIQEESGYKDGFTRKISKNKPWKPEEERAFKLKTKGIEIIYADYLPPFVVFEVGLKAKDPVGYNFEENIREENLLSKWEQYILKRND